MNPKRRRTSLSLAALGSAALAVNLLGMPSLAATGHGSSTRTSALASGAQSGQRTAGYYDARQLTGTALSRATRSSLESRSAATSAFFRGLGPQGVVDIDPLTHTPRNLTRLNGFLTGPSSLPARTVALNYVRAHLAQLGLTRADLATLRFHGDYVDTVGLHNLSWTQQVDGATVFGNGLKVKVTRNGQVVAVQGSPVSGLAQLAAAAPTTQKVDALQARTASAKDVHGRLDGRATVSSSRGGAAAETKWSNSDFSQRVWFLTPKGLRPGWSTYVQTSAGAYQHVIDAADGAVLYRHSNTDNDAGDARVYTYYPGAKGKGGKPTVVNLYKKGWLKKGHTFLKGTSVVTWDDVNDDNKINPGEKTPVPGTKHKAQFTLSPFGKSASPLCKTNICTWKPNQPYSWKKNRKADATNAFFLASNYHDYLEKKPIGFTPAAGNFSAKGGDPVKLNALDGANTLKNNKGKPVGLPDGNHVDNANMSTPPNGTSPTMQMYLWHQPGATAAQDPYVPTSGAFDASILYHEYTHGLSNRLVVDATGNSTLDDVQAGAMGEAWSDYYALDYLVSHGLIKDSGKPGQVREGDYVTDGTGIRTMAIDCPVHAKAKGCRSLDNPKQRGGYTYADFTKVIGIPEVHASGEIWAQTLWDLRKKLGHDIADNLITRGMEISPNDPDYLDMRNAIVTADRVAYDGRHSSAIWHVFAKRGMGFFAGSANSADTAPANDFHVPPKASTPHDGMIAGTVTDPTTGQPVQNAVVSVTGQSGQYQTLTDAHGLYEIHGLYIGTYAKVTASSPGYFGAAKKATAVRSGKFGTGDVTNFDITRDWAAVPGGSVVAAFDGPDLGAYGCGPAQALDTDLSTGWGSTTGDNDGTPTNVFVPKSLTVKLPKAVNISSFGVDPSATCGDGASASTGQYSIETSIDGSTWVPAASGTFTSANDGRLNAIAPAAGSSAGVLYVRFTILSNQTPDFATNCPGGAYSGCSYTDLTELAVFGS